MSDRSRAGAPKSNKSGLAHRSPLPVPARTIARTVLAILLVVLAIWVAFDLLPALGWAVVVAITIWRPEAEKLASAQAALERAREFDRTAKEAECMSAIAEAKQFTR
jgi:hypothetical protein